MNAFAGKTTIITGGASGIGRALGEELARRGAHVVLADVNAEEAEKVAASIVEAGFNARAATLDVTDFEKVTALVDETVTQHGTLDYMFNNAGIAVGGETQDFAYDDWRRVIDTNLYGIGTFFGQAVRPKNAGPSESDPGSHYIRWVRETASRENCANSRS